MSDYESVGGGEADTPEGTAVHEGELSKQGELNTAFKRRYFLLTTSELLWYKDLDSKLRDPQKPRGRMRMAGVSITAEGPGPLRLKVSPPDKCSPALHPHPHPTPNPSPRRHPYVQPEL